MIDSNSVNPSPKAQPTTGRQVSRGVLVILGIDFGVIIAFLISQDAAIYAATLAALTVVFLLVGGQPFKGIILWLLLMPFITIFPNTGVAYWAIYRLLTPAVLILAVISRVLKTRQYPPARFGPPELAMVALALFVPASAFLSQSNPSQALINYGDRILLPFCMYLAVRFLAPREREIYQLQWVAFFIVFSQASIGFLSWFAPQLLPSAWHYLNGVRTVGSLLDADLYSAMLTFSAVLLFQGAMNRKSVLVRLLFFTASGVSAIFVFLSLERAAWLAWVLVFIGLIFLFRRIMLRVILIGAFVMVILGTGFLSSHVSLSIERFSDPQPVQDRVVITDAMFQMIQLKPEFGWGYENLGQNLPHYYRRIGDASLTRRFITSHNTYLTIITELGVVGFMLTIFPVVWWLLLSLRVWRRIPKEGLWSRSLLAVFWLSMLFFFTISNFIDMRFFPVGLSMWWMLLGLIANMVYPFLKNRGTPLPAPVGLH